MTRFPSVWRLDALFKHASEVSACIDGRYVPARTTGFPSIGNRIHCAWLVFTGRADALIWPEDEWNDAGSTSKAALAQFATITGESHE